MVMEPERRDSVVLWACCVDPEGQRRADSDPNVPQASNFAFGRTPSDRGASRTRRMRRIADVGGTQQLRHKRKFVRTRHSGSSPAPRGVDDSLNSGSIAVLAHGHNYRCERIARSSLRHKLSQIPAGSHQIEAGALAAGDSDRLRLVLVKAEDVEPHANVERGAWTRAGRHAGGGASAIDRPRRSISLTRALRSSTRVR